MCPYLYFLFFYIIISMEKYHPDDFYPYILSQLHSIWYKIVDIATIFLFRK